MKIKALLLCMYCLAISNRNFCQQLSFQKTYTFRGGAAGLPGACTRDGGYIIAGVVYPAGPGDADIYIIKTDSSGDIEWSRTFGLPADDAAYSIQQTTDGGYIVGCNTYTSLGNNDFLLVKIDSAGNLMWQKKYDNGAEGDNLEYAIQTSDGGYIMIGSTTHVLPCCRDDMYVIKTDSLGNVLWNKTYHGPDNYEFGMCIQQTTDGGFVFTGSKDTGAGTGPFLTWLIKTDSVGNKLWERAYGYGRGNSIRQTMDGGYVIAGYSDVGYDNAMLIKTDSSGFPEWEKVFLSPTLSKDQAFSVVQTGDSGFAVTGYMFNTMFLIRTNKYGDSLWTRFNLGLGAAVGYDIHLAADGGFAVFGETIDTVTYDRSAFLIKTDSNGLTQCNEIRLLISDSTVSLFSIPSSFSSTVSASISSPLLAIDSGSSTKTICFSGLPVTGFTAVQGLCPGTCTDFTNLSLDASSYQWSFQGASPGTSTSISPANICYPNPGSYDVQLIATNANGSDTLLLTNYITVYPFPSPQSITQNEDTLYAMAGAGTYQWYLNGIAISGATDYFYVAAQGGDYNVVATDVNGCEVEAAIFNVVAGLEATVGSGSKQFIIFPNPVGDKLIIQKLEVKSETAGSILIYNLLGELILAVCFPTANCTLPTEADVSTLPPGMYYLEIISSSASAAGRLYHSKFVKD
jgi:hypothetical protein